VVTEVTKTFVTVAWNTGKTTRFARRTWGERFRVVVRTWGERFRVVVP
jgi:hypothetical protein